MISALEVGVRGEHCFINLHIPTTVLFKMFIFINVFVNGPNRMCLKSETASIKLERSGCVR